MLLGIFFKKKSVVCQMYTCKLSYFEKTSTMGHVGAVWVCNSLIRLQARYSMVSIADDLAVHRNLLIWVSTDIEWKFTNEWYVLLVTDRRSV